MADKSTEGFLAEAEEVEAVLHSLCGYHLAERDPLQRYNVLTREQVIYDALVAAIRRERGRALAELVTRGHSMTEVAGMTNLRTRQRVQRLIAFGRASDEAAPQVPAGSREFEEKLAAVSATLEAVHTAALADRAERAPAVRAPYAPAARAPHAAAAAHAAAVADTATASYTPGISAITTLAGSEPPSQSRPRTATGP